MYVRWDRRCLCQCFSWMLHRHCNFGPMSRLFRHLMLYQKYLLNPLRDWNLHSKKCMYRCFLLWLLYRSVWRSMLCLRLRYLRHWVLLNARIKSKTDIHFLLKHRSFHWWIRGLGREYTWLQWGWWWLSKPRVSMCREHWALAERILHFERMYQRDAYRCDPSLLFCAHSKRWKCHVWPKLLPNPWLLSLH